MRMKRMLSIILVLLLLISLLPLQAFAVGGRAAETPATEAPYAQGRVLVQLASGLITPFAEEGDSLDLGIAFSEMRLLNPARETEDARILSVDDTQNNVFVLTLDEDISVQEAVDILNANPAVEIAEPDLLYKPFSMPNDPYLSRQWALQTINASQAWSITTGNRSVVVGIIDTGISGTHPDLAGNLWVNPSPGQSGYVNDIHGFNFADQKGGIPYDLASPTHGTHVAGIVGAVGNNGVGVSGVNWNVSLAWMGISPNGSENLLLSAAIEALNYANNHNIRIVNSSWGGYGYSTLLRQAIANYNGLFIASAGNDTNNNDTYPAYPASYNLPNIISVASTDQGDTLSYFSNYGATTVHIAAPGGNILSTYGASSYAYLDGTSMAAPQVAGVAALVLAENPDYSAEQIRTAILNGVDKVPNLSGWVVTGGRLNAYNALTRSPVTSISLAPGALTLDINQMRTLAVQTVPAGMQTPLDWVSSDPSIVQVAPNGTLLALRSGTATITASAVLDPTVTASATVTVTGTALNVVPFRDFNFKQGVIDALIALDPVTYAGYTLASDLYPADVAQITELSLDRRYIVDLSGITYFTGIETLSLANNQLNAVDFSANTALTSLDVSGNNLTTINVSSNTALTVLNVYMNQLTGIDVSGNPALTVLDVGSNYLTNIDLSNNTALSALYVDSNRLTSLDVAMHTADTLFAYDNPFANISFQSGGQTVDLAASGPGYVGLVLSRADAEFYALATPSYPGPATFFCWTESGARIDGDDTFALTIGQSYDLTAHFGVFTDVPAMPWGWAQLYVLEASEKGIMQGDGAGNFNPGGLFNRAEAITVLWKLAGRPIPTSSAPFSDVAPTDWFAEAVAWAAEAGVVAGRPDGTFAPRDTIERQEFFAMLRNFAGAYLGLDVTPGAAPNWPFPDGDLISPWAVDAVRWVNAEGIAMGNGLGQINPLGTANRAEAAALAVRFARAFMN